MQVDLLLPAALDPMLVDQSPSPRHGPSRGSCRRRRLGGAVARAFQHYLDRAAPHARRWAGTLVAATLYVLWVYYVRGFVISHGLGISLLNLLIGFLSPMVDQEVEALEVRPRLPTHGSNMFKPFICLPEFKF